MPSKVSGQYFLKKSSSTIIFFPSLFAVYKQFNAAAPSKLTNDNRRVYSAGFLPNALPGRMATPISCRIA